MRDLARLVARSYQDGLSSAESFGWTITEVARGYNGIVFRARSADYDLAAKVSRIDERDRAGRELDALGLLQGRHQPVAPEPVGVVRSPDGIPVAILLAGWLPGMPVEHAPAPHSGVWSNIIETYASIHAQELYDLHPSLRPAVLGVDVGQVVTDMRGRADGTHDALIDAADASIPATLPTGLSRRLIHCDANLANVLLDGSAKIVDWENSGWGDPCFDIANIVMTPQLADRSLEDWEPLFVKHAGILGDPRLAERTRAHALVMAAWWVVRLRQEIATPTARLSGVERPDIQTRKELLEKCEERAAALLLHA